MIIATVCSGIGSPEQALNELNIRHEISFACEIGKYAKKSYLQNFTPNMMLSDMTKESWKGKEFYSDLFIGGIPCQSFSLAGKRLGELDPRGLLFYDFYRYVKEQKPKYFIIENVKGLLSDNNGNTFRNWINLLGQSENGTPFFFPHEDSLLYNLHWEVLNTKDYELPQNRERVFLVGIRNDLPNDFVFPAKKPLKLRLKDVLESNADDKYYLSDKLLKGFIAHSDRHTENGNGFKFEPKNDESIANSITASCYKMATTDNYVIAAMRGRNPEKPTARIAGQKTEQMLEINENGISNCLSTVQKDNLVVAYRDNSISNIRRLTPLECFRLQGYPDQFFYNCQNVNSDTQLYKQAGNTISVTVIKAILKNLLSD
ncbi:DNA cytosine methyltransferase [Chryseobacterium sp. EO14]|uniref:DNA cytosine methyltransferase n=1 Tax=Chryseobacterium sp. EO14 TaxID=2950551 RepID=UPI0021096929|nr:DNA cytosine methyltransferase [Chryseobacterium sp. EO14]MCQ4139204.1 DNA cytosine methyltransferase [Chryseobacterium sp. EO14]